MTCSFPLFVDALCVSQAELDLRVSQDQVNALKKHNAQLACRCREEAKAKLKEHEERVETQDKVGSGLKIVRESVLVL